MITKRILEMLAILGITSVHTPIQDTEEDSNQVTSQEALEEWTTSNAKTILPRSEEPYDYCLLTKYSSEVDQYRVQLETGEMIIRPETLFEGNLETIGSLDLSLDDIVHPQPRSDYEILLVPVGYEDDKQLNARMDSFLDVLSRAFEGVNVSFSYLEKPVPLGIQHVGLFPELTNQEEANTLLRQINEFSPVDTLAIVFNHPDIMGSSGEYPLFSGIDFIESPFGGINSNTHAAIHEIGHHLGLWDGYTRFYSSGERNMSELFLSFSSLSPEIHEAVSTVQPPIVETGNVCEGRTVYTFYNLNNDIMDRFYYWKEITTMLEREESPFNPLQIEIMNNYIRRLTENKD